MKFEKHPTRPSTYAAEDTASGHRYLITKTVKGDWRLTITATGYLTETHYASTKKLMVELAEQHNAQLWIEQKARLHKA